MIEFSASGTGNYSKTFGNPMMNLEIINDGLNQITVTVNGTVITVLGQEQFEGDFEPFYQMDIAATGPWRFLVEGNPTSLGNVVLVSDIIDQVRTNINDKEVLEYLPKEMLNYFNQANRFLYRIVGQYLPEMLLPDTPETVPLIPGTSLIKMLKRPLRMICVQVDGKNINAGKIDYSGRAGKPTDYSIYGIQGIRLYPIPDKNYSCSVFYVPEPPQLKESDDIGWPTAFQDFLTEYMTIRAPLRNEFNMTQEAQVMSPISDQIILALSDMMPSSPLIQGYL